MATKKSMWVLFGILVISAWIFGSVIQAGAETMKYRTALTSTKHETIPVGDEEGQPKSGTSGPVITGSYAIDKGYYGIIWKIYIEAEAQGAEMAKIAAVVDQPCQGHYPTDFTLLKAPYRNHLKGYLQWNTLSSTGIALIEGDQFILRVSIIDKAGNESNKVVFPFTVVSGVKGQGSLPAPFDQGDIPRLGFIDIDLSPEDPGLVSR